MHLQKNTLRCDIAIGCCPCFRGLLPAMQLQRSSHGIFAVCSCPHMSLSCNQLLPTAVGTHLHCLQVWLLTGWP